MVGILMEPNYAESLWCQNLYNALTQELRWKRISFCDITDILMPLEAVFVIASDREWMHCAIRQLNDCGIKPILICNHSEQLIGCLYSCVCSDINASMKKLMDMLTSKGKRRVALYGMNADSVSDISRVDSLFHWRSDHFATMRIFHNTGSLESCFAEFYPHIDQFDAVICANDFAAISLVRHLRETAPDALESLCIISCAQTQLANFYRTSIVSLNMHFEQYGKAAVYVYNALQKHDYLSSMTVRVLWSLDAPPDMPPRQAVRLQLRASSDAFYHDASLNEMLIVDKLLQCADETETQILRGLLRGDTVCHLAEKCFLTEGAVKYRIKKLIAASGAEDKNQVIALMKKYIPTPENI